VQQVALAPGVLEAQFKLEQAWLRRAADSASPDAAGPSLKRLAEAVLRVAGLLALETATGTVATLRTDHLALARQIGERWLVSTPAAHRGPGADDIPA
jgi:hypothetical protein